MVAAATWRPGLINGCWCSVVVSSSSSLIFSCFNWELGSVQLVCLRICVVGECSGDHPYTRSILIIVLTQFACRPAALSRSLVPRIWDSRALRSKVNLGLCAISCLFCSDSSLSGSLGARRTRQLLALIRRISARICAIHQSMAGSFFEEGCPGEAPQEASWVDHRMSND